MSWTDKEIRNEFYDRAWELNRHQANQSPYEKYLSQRARNLSFMDNLAAAPAMLYNMIEHALGPIFYSASFAKAKYGTDTPHEQMVAAQFAANTVTYPPGHTGHAIDMINQWEQWREDHKHGTESYPAAAGPNPIA